MSDPKPVKKRVQFEEDVSTLFMNRGEYIALFVRTGEHAGSYIQIEVRVEVDGRIMVLARDPASVSLLPFSDVYGGG